MLFGHWLRYNNFPCFNTEGASGGGPAAPAEPAETTKELSEAESFVLEAFEEMQKDDDGDEGPVVQSAVEPAEGAPAVEEIPAAKPVSPPKEAAQTPAKTAEPVAATPHEPVAPAQTAPQQGAVEPAARTPQAAPEETTLQGFAQALEEQRGVFAKKLGEKRYQLTAEDQERLNTDPASFIPELAGRIQVETTQSMMRVLWNQLPGLVNTIVTQKVQNDRAENAFWEANKDLNRANHAELVKNAGELFRKQFKDADEATFHRSVGQMVRGMLGMTALAVQPAAQTNGQQSVLKTPGTVVRQVQPGFRPAGGNAAPAATHRPQVGQWESMLSLIERDNAGDFD